MAVIILHQDTSTKRASEEVMSSLCNEFAVPAGMKLGCSRFNGISKVVVVW